MTLILHLLGCVASDAGLDGGPPGDDGGVESLEDGLAHDMETWEERQTTPDGRPRPPEDTDADAFYAEGTLHDIHLSIPESGRASLALNPKGFVPGTFRYNGRTWPVEIRLKGTTTFRPLSGKAAFRVDFDNVDPDARFHGRKRLTLNSMLQDSSMLHEHVAYWLYRHRGVPAPRHTFARVWLDDELYGLYGVVETMDEQLLDRVLPDDEDGNLYEANLADFHVGDERKYELEETGGLAEPYLDLEALTAAIAAAPPAAYLDALDATFDLDALLRMMAIDIVSGNVDGYTRLRNNYMVYNAVESGRWYLLPWGHDQSFQWHQGVAPYTDLHGHLAERCGASPACTARLTTEIEALLVDWEDGAFATMVSDATSLVQADCGDDPRAELPCDAAHVLAFVLARPATVREDLAEANEEAAEE